MDEMMEFVKLARCPPHLKDAQFGRWKLTRMQATSEQARDRIQPFTDYVVLLYDAGGLQADVVMEDSPPELLTHWEFYKAAKGRVLISGLGLGCIVRAVAAKPEVEHVTVLEIDRFIIGHVGAEFSSNPKVQILEQDALKFSPAGFYDCAWHDIYTDKGNGLALAKLHTRIMVKLQGKIGEQGAWNYPKEVAEVGGFKWAKETHVKFCKVEG